MTSNGVVTENERLRKQRDDLVRSNQNLEKMNRELTAELEAQLRMKMGDEVVDESLSILNPLARECRLLRAKDKALSQATQAMAIRDTRTCQRDDLQLQLDRADTRIEEVLNQRDEAVADADLLRAERDEAQRLSAVWRKRHDAHHEEIVDELPEPDEYRDRLIENTGKQLAESFTHLFSGEPSLVVESDAVHEVEEHCDDFIHDLDQPEALRWFLFVNRLPALDKYLVIRHAGNPKLFAKLGDCWVQVIMASRLGDVGISYDLKADRGYEMRLMVSKMTDFAEEVPDEQG